ncbi:hypothetical protein [Tardiphaga sp. 841_E9_N1_2]|uniref:hypothetical protein n=1 Tax=Tardiphaga sp. 841_E9_N1_2 TaxID=3240762 RepID=UPI003F24DF99
MVYHHTSTLRTNLIWMSGVIELEGKEQPAQHPHLGKVLTNTSLRREAKDFPALAWFTRQVSTPNCLMKASIFYLDENGIQRSLDMSRDMVNVYALHRMALGFPIADIAVTHWPDHPGYDTPEGRDLNESAIEAGDDPADWYVSETPVDVLRSTQIWCTRSMLKPKLERWDWYLKDVHNMVQMCRKQSAYIPPSWMKQEDAHMLCRMLGYPTISGAAR